MSWRETASAQDGIVTRAQLRDDGLGDAAISRMLSDGSLCALARGAFVVGGAPLTYRARLWVAVLATDGVLGFATAALLSLSAAHAGEKSLIDTTRSPSAKFYMPDLADVRWHGGLLGERFEVCRTTMVPHMWTIFSDKNESHAWDNFLMAAGLGTGRDGKPHGPSFNDGDFLKWVEALSQIYAVTRDPAIDRQLGAGAAAALAVRKPAGDQRDRVRDAGDVGDHDVRPHAVDRVHQVAGSKLGDLGKTQPSGVGGGAGDGSRGEVSADHFRGA